MMPDKNIGKTINQWSVAVCLMTGLLFQISGCGGGGGSGGVTPPEDPPPAKSTNANLAGISLSSGELDQIFQADVFDYSASVGYLTKAIRVYLTVEDIKASVSVNDVQLQADSYSQFIELQETLNPAISIRVTAEDGSTIRDYSLTVTRATALNFDQAAYIKAFNTDSNDEYGSALAVHGNTLAVAALNEQSGAVGIDGDEADNSLIRSGAVYVYGRSAAIWSRQAYIKASNTAYGDDFGAAVALWGDTLIIGAPGEDSSATGVNGNETDDSAVDSGAVYVFTRSGGVWSQQAYIKASNTGAGDLFGTAVALDRDILVVGAPFEQSGAKGLNGDEESNSEDDSGAVYVFQRVDANWVQTAYIKSLNSEFNDQFGSSVDISGFTMVVGAPGEDSGVTGVNGNGADNSKGGSGAAYVIEGTGSGWIQQAYLKAGNSDAADAFGSTIAVDGNMIAVGAPYEDSGGTLSDNSQKDSGAVYVFGREAGSWHQRHYLKATVIEAFDNFGSDVSLDGFTLAMSAPLEDSAATGFGGDPFDNALSNSGSVTLAHFSGTPGGLGSWSVLGYLKALNTGFEDRFGMAVSTQGDVLAIGAPLEDSAARGIGGDEADNTQTNTGAVYLWQ